jgi:hypothetical protein
MFRLQDNVPQIYVEESRDFQLFCRLYDCINNGVKYDIDSMITLLDPMLCKDRVLDLLATKVGFFHNSYIESDILRYIISAFPYILKYKGSKRGVKEAVITILRAEGKFEIPQIDINNENYEIKIELNKTNIKNKKALDEVLKYILPIGYTYSIGSYTTRESADEFNVYDMKADLMINPASSTSQVRGSSRIKASSDNGFDFETTMEDDNIGVFINTQVIGSAIEKNLETNIYSTDRLGVSRDDIDKSSNKEIKEVPIEGEDND